MENYPIEVSIIIPNYNYARFYSNVSSQYWHKHIQTMK